MRLCQSPVSQRPSHTLWHPGISPAAAPTRKFPLRGFFPLSFFLCLLLGGFKGKLVLFPPLFILNRLFLSACTRGYLFYSPGCCNPSLCFLLLLNRCLFWPLRMPRFPPGLPNDLPFLIFPLHLEYSLNSGTTTCSRSSCAFSCPDAGSSCVSRELQFCSSVYWKIVFVV